MDMLICPNCGNRFEARPGALRAFCPMCGTGVEIPAFQAQPDIQPAAEPVINPDADMNAGYQNVQEPAADPGVMNYQEPVQNPDPYTAPAQPDYTQQSYQQPDYQQPYHMSEYQQQTYTQPAPQGNDKAKKAIIIAAAGIAVLAVFIALYYFVLRPIPITSIKINKDDYDSDKNAVVLNIGDNYEIDYDLSPSDNRHDNLTWESDNTEVATVENGTVTAIGEGTCTVKVTGEKNGVSATIDIEVDVVAEEISLTRTSVTVNAGETAVISVNFTPENTTDKHCEWESDDTMVATVKDGIVTGVAEGTCTITVTSVYGPTAECTVTVTKPKPESFIIGTWSGYYAKNDDSSLNLQSGQVTFIINADGTATHYFGDYTWTMTWKYIRTDDDGDYVYYFYYDDSNDVASLYYLNSGNDAGEIQFADNGVHVWYTKSTTAA